MPLWYHVRLFWCTLSATFECIWSFWRAPSSQLYLLKQLRKFDIKRWKFLATIAVKKGVFSKKNLALKGVCFTARKGLRTRIKTVRYCLVFFTFTLEQKCVQSFFVLTKQFNTFQHFKFDLKKDPFWIVV